MRRILLFRSCLETAQLNGCVFPSWTRPCSDKAPPSDSDEPTLDPNKPKLRSKVRQHYRPVHGVNAPYAKLPPEMSGYVFRDLRTCQEVENCIYELWDRLTMREVEAACHALKRLNAYPPASLMDDIAKKTMELTEEINCRHVTSLFLSLSRIKYYNPGMFNAMAKELMKPDKLQDTLGSSCGTIIYALGALQRHFERDRTSPVEGKMELFFPLQMELVETLVHRIVSVRDEDGLSNTNISNFMYGLAMMKHRHVPLLNILAEEAARPERLAIYNEQEMSNIIYSMGVLNYSHGLLLSNFCLRLCDSGILHSWSEQGLSNVIYGFALLNYTLPKETMFSLTWEVCQSTRLAKFHNQHLMNVIHGLAILGMKNIRVFRNLLDELLQRRHKFEFMLAGIASVVYSFAKAGINAEGLKVFLADLTEERHIHQLGDQSLCNLIFAIGKLESDEELLPFMEKLMKEAVDSSRLSRYTERHVAHILYGLAKSRFHTRLKPACIQHMLQGVRTTLPTSTDQGLANIVFALAHMGCIDKEMHDTLATETVKRMERLAGITIASIIYAWGLISYKNGSFLESVSAKLLKPGTMEEYPERVLSNILFGLHRIGSKNDRLFRALLAHIKKSHIWETFVYQTSPDCMKELLQMTWMDEPFKDWLQSELKYIYATRGDQQTTKLSM